MIPKSLRWPYRPEYEPEYKILIFQATCEETENGPVYGLDWENMDWDAPEAKMRFTNTYTAHNYTLKHDETEHWDECGCGNVQNREAHQYGEWTITKEATETQSGEKKHTCTVCGYTEKVEIEKLPAAGTPSNTDTPTDNGPTDDTIPPKTDDNRTGDTTSPETGNNSNTTLWIAVVLAAGAALTGAILYNRKKKYCC